MQTWLFGFSGVMDIPLPFSKLALGPSDQDDSPGTTAKLVLPSQVLFVSGEKNSFHILNCII